MKCTSQEKCITENGSLVAKTLAVKSHSESSFLLKNTVMAENHFRHGATSTTDVAMYIYSC